MSEKVSIKAEAIEAANEAAAAAAAATAAAATADPIASNTAVFDDPTLLSALFGNPNANANTAISDDNDDDDDDDDDEIIREIDVYISPELANTMHLIQFPLQPATHAQTFTNIQNSHTNNNHKQQQQQQQQQAKHPPQPPPPPQPTSAKIKPNHSMLQLSYTIPRSSFSSQRQIPAPLSLSERIYSSHSIPIVTHMAIGIFDPGSPGKSDGTCRGGTSSTSSSKIDLVPLQKILQMRPSFAHVDAIYENSAENSNDKEEDTTIDISKEDKNTTTTTPILFQKPESERAASQRLSSYAYKKAHEDSEEWIDLDVQGYKSHARREIMKKAHCPVSSTSYSSSSSVGALMPMQVSSMSMSTMPMASTSTSSSTNTNTNTRDNLQFIKGGAMGGSVGYVKSLNYLPSTVIVDSVEDFTMDQYPNEHEAKHEHEHEHEQTDLGVAGTTTTTTTTTNEPEWKKELTSRVATLLQERGGFPIPYSIIRSRFQRSIPDEALIEAISASAVLVRGNFILKTSLMALSNVYVENTRDVILILMQKYGVVQRVKLYKAFQGCNVIHGNGNGNGNGNGDNDVALIVTMDVINSLLDLMGRKTMNGVEMKIDDDLMFESQYPDVAKFHAMYWDRKEKELRRYIRLYEEQDDVVDTNELSEMFSGKR